MKHIGDANGADGATGTAAFEYRDVYDHRVDDATAVVPDGSLLFSGTYHQSGQDLIITKSFETVTIHDYFRYDVKPALVAPDGSSLNAAVVLALTEGRPGLRYAGDEPARVTAIGRVETATGTATVIRNGQSIVLHAGDLVFKGDAVETGEHGALAITFIDGTTFTLAESARMVLNDMVYQPGGSNNSSLLSLVQGSITFVAGEVAHTGEMKVDTPVATMGIRGTAVHVNISAHDGPTRFSVMREPDGRVGSYILYDHKDGSQLATVSEVGNVVELQLNNGQIVINSMPKSALDFQQEQALTQQVFATFQAGQQDSLLRALMQTHDPSGGGSHGSSGPPQTGPSGGELNQPSGNQPNTPGSDQPTPQPFQSTPSPPHPTDNGQPQQPLPILAPVPAPTAPVETIILAKNTAIDTNVPISAETIVGIQASNGSFTPVGSQGTTIHGLYGDLTISPDGSLHYTADHALALGAGALGFDSFNYTVENSANATATGTLTFDVVGASNNPIVTGPVSGGTISAKAPVQTINLLSGAIDPNPNETVTLNSDGTAHAGVQVSVISGPVNANAILFNVDSSGHLTIDPSQFTTFDSSDVIKLAFSYTLVDASGGATAQTATLTVDAPPTASYAAAPTIYSIYSSAPETPVLKSAADDPVHLDTASLAADGWTPSTGGTWIYTPPYGVVVTYGTATLDAQGDVTYQLTTTPPPGVMQETFTVPFVDGFGVATSGNAVFTIDKLQPDITAPATQTIGVGHSTAITGISLAESGSTSDETFSATITDTHGLLSVTGSGGTVTGSGSPSLTISGVTFGQLNTYLASLTDTNSTPGSDTITISASDSFGNNAAQESISVTTNGSPVIEVSSPQTIGVNQTAAIHGVHLSESGNTSAETFSATISDTYGLLSVTSGGGGTISGLGTTSLTITGVTLTELAAYRGSLTDTDATAGTDTIVINATDSFGNSAAEQTITVTVNDAPSISVPGAQTLGVNQPTTISGLSISESGITDGETFNVTVSDTHGALSATGAVVSNSGTSLTLSGTFSQINNDLSTLTDTDATPGSDTITLNASDGFGNHATQQTIGVTSVGLPSISVPGAQTLGVNQPTVISGLSLSESGITDGETFNVTVSDTHGALSATGAVVSNSGTSLTLSGTLTQINNDLTTLTDTDATPGCDTITLNASDGFGNYATQQTIGVTANGAPELTVPGAEVIVAGQLTVITGIGFSETGNTGGEIFTAMLTDTHGDLSVSGSGGTVTGSGTSLTITGSLDEVQSYLASLTDTDSTPGADTITLTVSDSLNNHATQTIGVTAIGQNLVTNGGFETGDLSGWTSNGLQTQYDHVQTGSVHSGNYSLELGAVGGDYTLDQSIPTVAGQTYQVEFWLTNPGGTPSDFNASFDGVTLLSLTNSNGQSYTEYSYDITATSPTSDLHFAARQDPSFWYLDDVSVTSIGALVVAANATLGISNAVAAGTAVTFSSGNGTLDLDNPANFHGQIAGISGSGDVLDLNGFDATYTGAMTGNGSFNNATDTTALTITDSHDGLSAILTLAGNYSGSTWNVTDDGHGGVNIVDPPASETTSILSGLAASVQSDGGNGDFVALTGQVTGSDDTGTIAWDQGGSTSPLTVTNGAFSVNQDLTPGDHIATLTFNDAATNTKAAQTIDIDIGGSDAPFVFAPATNPAVLVGSASANVSQTLAGSTAYQDTIVAGAGNDTLTGNYTGGDTFVFKPNMGNDQITDLHTAGLNGTHDTIDLSAFHFANYQALLAATTTDASGDATIALGSHTLTLDHVQKADLQSDLFHL